jgi:hypothetical protein
MRMMRIGLAFVGAAIATVGFAPRAMAFHDGGVAYCDGCHTMHNSSGNVRMSKNGGSQFNGNAFLLQGSDPSSTCLNCHGAAGASSYHIFNPSITTCVGTACQSQVVTAMNEGPGGDFAWLKMSPSWSLPRAATNPGERHGHNVVAADYGLVADPLLTTSPGGSYAGANLSCVSCHDPHSAARIADTAGTIQHRALGTAVKPICSSGSYGALPDADCAVGVYRLLGGAGYQDPASVVAFAANPPLAVAPSTYNRTEAATETRVAYGKGVSQWCANCHGAIHNTSLGNKLEHPTDQTLTGAIVANYSAYVKSGDLTGTVATSYTSLVPFEEGTASTLATLALNAVNDGSKTQGADASSRVMCLTCHRAHATGFKSMTRWNNAGEFLTTEGIWPGVDQPVGSEANAAAYNQGWTQAQYSKAMYDRPATKFAFVQRSMCNKCHAKD